MGTGAQYPETEADGRALSELALVLQAPNVVRWGELALGAMPVIPNVPRMIFPERAADLIRGKVTAALATA